MEKRFYTLGSVVVVVLLVLSVYGYFSSDVLFSPLSKEDTLSTKKLDLKNFQDGDLKRGGVPEDCDPIVINDGDAFFGDSDWKWILRNLDQVSPTRIDSPSSISGPTIGIANSFEGVDGAEGVLSEPDWSRGWEDAREMWSLPNGYISVVYSDLWPLLDHSSDSGDRGQLEVKVERDTVNLVEAKNVPENYQKLLKKDANVVSLTVRSPSLNPYDAVPSIMLDWQLNFIGLGNSIWAYDEYDGYSYYARFSSANLGGSVSFEVTRIDCNPPYSYCQYERVPEMDFHIDRGKETDFLNRKIYNLYSGQYPQEYLGEDNYKEWAVVSTYWDGEVRTKLPSTNRLIYFPFTNERTGQREVLVFYRDYFENSLFYLESIQLAEFFSEWTSHKIDYYDDIAHISLADFQEEGVDYFGLILTQTIVSPEHIGYEDNILAKFEYDKEKGVLSLGKESNTPELGELVYYYSPSGQDSPWSDALEIGGRGEDSRTAHGSLVRSPKQNSLKDSVSWGMFSTRASAYASLEKEELCRSRSFGHSVFLGNDIFLGNRESDSWYLPWLVDDTTQFGSYVNPLGFESWVVDYSGENLEMSEVFVAGTNYPSVETSLTKPYEKYGSGVYFESGRAYDSSEYRDEGLKYIQAFDSSVDLGQLSEENRIPLYFSGKYFEIVKYNSPTSLTVQPYCSSSTCGNGAVDSGEECDGSDFGGLTCEDFGFERWWGLSCVPRGEPGECTIDTSCCESDSCGDGVVDGWDGEQCDDGCLQGNPNECDFADNGDGCSEECKFEFCGDGVCGVDRFGAQEDCNNCPVDCGTCCFLEGTKVLTPSGEMDIQDVEVGDVVLSYDLDQEEKVSGNVLETFVHDTGSYLVVNGRIKVTSEHPVYLNGVWQKIGDAKLGDLLKTLDGSERIYSIEEFKDTVKVYNLNVDGNDNYFAEGILVHNKPPEECQIWSERLPAFCCDNVRSCSDYITQVSCDEVPADACVLPDHCKWFGDVCGSGNGEGVE